MSKIYEALQRAQEEREGVTPLEAERTRRRSWFRSRRPRSTNGHRSHVPTSLRIDFDLAPDVEEAYQRLGTNLLTPSKDPVVLRDLMVVASLHGEGTTLSARVRIT